MEDIKTIVDEILQECQDQHVQDVDHTLAAFVAKTVVLDHAQDFQLNKQLTEDDLEKMIQRSVEKLKSESVPMQTIRMQVRFDQMFLDAEEAMRRALSAKQSRLRTLRGAIVANDTQGSDYDKINAVFRQTFNYLLAAGGADTAKDRAIDREIAAAMESVFPKVGLKAFLEMPVEDQKLQLEELSSVVKGIRLFNKHIGKGGAGITDVPLLARQQATELASALQEEREHAQLVCDELSEVLMFLHRQGAASDADAEEAQVELWRQQLTNRRQYAAVLASLEDDMHQSLRVLKTLETQFNDVMLTLQDYIGGRSSVSKEKVYPKFDEAATIWDKIEEEFDLIQSRKS